MENSKAKQMYLIATTTKQAATGPLESALASAACFTVQLHSIIELE